MDHEDGELAADRQLLGEVVRYIRKLRPEAVFTHSTDMVISNRWINHMDHRATGLTAVDAVYPTARDTLNFPEHLSEGFLLEPHKVRQISLGGNESTFEVDVIDVIDLKLEALLLHNSQFGAREDFQTHEGTLGRRRRALREKFKLVELLVNDRR